MTFRALGGLVFALVCTACAGTQMAATHAHAPAAPTVVLPTTYVTASDSGTLQDRFDRASAWLASAEYAMAAAAFDKLASLPDAGAFAPAALFNAGLSYEGALDNKTALQRYRQLLARFARAPEAKLAQLHSVRLLARAEDWKALGNVAAELAQRQDLRPIERIEAYGALALALVEQDQEQDAAPWVAKARTIVEEERFDQGAQLPLPVAQVYFALGEVRRLRGEAITFVPMPSDFAAELERRCQLLLDAQDAYAQAMRAYDAHWSTMAGYRVGQLYQRLHRDIMSIPEPASAKTDRQKLLFKGAMQLRYRVLLDKGLRMLDRTLAMAERTGQDSAWVERAREAQRDLQQAASDARAAIEQLPYSEQDLQRALQSLAQPSP